jgi:acyl phosphate:glycerol-3-phosphate acyltransferase
VATALFTLIGYLCGSVPSGVWIVRVFKGADIRTVGSGNIGGTNVWRVYGRWYGLPVVFLDAAKGFAPALAATLVAGHGAGVLAGGAAMLGHWRPLFLRWQRGGKMVATAGGAFLGVAPLVGGCGAAVWIVVFLLFRYASVASILASASLPLWSWLLGYPWPVIAFGGFAGAGVLVLHRENVRRLLRGEENRFVLRGRRRGGAVSGSASP